MSPRSIAAKAALVQKARSAIDKQQQKLVRLTARFLQLRNQLERDAVETMREMGKVLSEGRALAARGYTAWVEQELGISRSAAGNYRRVFAMSQSTPEVFVNWKNLGPSKVIRLARVEPQKRKVVVRKKLGSKTVSQMTDAEFGTVTKPFLAITRPVTANMLAHGLHNKLRAIVDTLTTAQQQPPADDPTLRKKLRTDVADIVRAARALQKCAC